MGQEVRGRNSDFAYASLSGAGDIYNTGGDTFADIMLEMPDGDTWEFVRVWGSDTNVPEDLQFFAFERCLPSFVGGPVVQTNLADVESTTSAGDFSALISIPAATVVDNTGCTYAVRVRFDATGSSLRVFKARTQSVSP